MEQIEKIFQELRKEVITIKQAEQQVLDLFAVSGSVYPKCLKCEFEGMIASNEKEWESGEYFGYNSSNNTVYCPRCSNVQHYR
jgi:hypothetical protein